LERKLEQLLNQKGGINFTLLPFKENDPVVDPFKVETTIASSMIFVPILSKDCLKEAAVVFALECAVVYPSVRTVLMHGILKYCKPWISLMT
jgi:hypothetical protein